MVTPEPSGTQGGREEKGVSISVFLPCYNEQGNVARTAEQAIGVLKKAGFDYEVIIIDDGSSDATGVIAEAVAKRFAGVRVIHHPVNKGYGAALQSGFRAARKDLIFFTDGDGQFDIDELPALVPLMKDCDIVACYRLNRQDPVLRKINGWLWTKLVCALFGMKVRDIDCAFKLYKREIFDNISMSSTGALINAEILAKATKKGYRIKQVGVHHYPRTSGAATGAKLRVIVRAFRELFELYGRIRRGR